MAIETLSVIDNYNYESNDESNLHILISLQQLSMASLTPMIGGIFIIFNLFILFIP